MCHPLLRNLGIDHANLRAKKSLIVAGSGPQLWKPFAEKKQEHDHVGDLDTKGLCSLILGNLCAVCPQNFLCIIS